MVTITSEAERGFIYEKLGNNEFWIGASDTAVEGRFAWVTGEKWLYEKWIGSNSDEGDYVYSYYRDGWARDTNTGTAIYVCEWSAHNYIGRNNSLPTGKIVKIKLQYPHDG
uniref:lectin-like protein n=1 Tax=Crenothrix polyspora TaxID=360316 RepID=UPI001C4EE0B7